MTLTAMVLATAVKDEAWRLGFDAAAIGPATPPTHGGAFDRWLDDGYAGSMDYLARTRRERRDPAMLLPGVRAVVTVAMSYRPADEASATGQSHGGMRVARYAGGRDYHEVMRPRLEALANFISRAAGPGVKSRAAVDTSAVLERDVAARAGLGWVGKNTNLLTQSLGSWFFIGAVLTSAEAAFDTEVPDRCGTCTACLDACPTAAFTAPYVLDARRCIAYLTIEHRGDIDEAFRPAIGAWGFGCDICQEVCPWNRKAATTREPAFAGTAPMTPEALLELDEAAFRERFRGTALWRAHRAGLLRNAAIVLGNLGDRAAVPALRRALADPDPVVQRAAAWALSRLHAASSGEGRDRNEAETGEPIQLDNQKHDEKQKDQRPGEQRQGGQQHQGGGQHQQGGQQPNRPAQARPDERQQKPA